MRKILATLSLAFVMIIANVNFGFAQEGPSDSTQNPAQNDSTEQPAVDPPITNEPTSDVVVDEKPILKQESSIVQEIKQYFVDGGPIFMALVFACLLIGLAICIERIVYLNMSTVNSKTLLGNIENAMSTGGLDAAKEVCRNTRGPIASIFYQGLDRADEGVDVVEKSIINYGGVQAGKLEKNLSWIALFIAIAPMLGFMGTVIGLVGVFNTIEATGKADAGQLAGDLKLAFITTLGGLVVAIILQIFYNYIVSKIDGLINEMEDASISLVDLVVKNKAGA